MNRALLVVLANSELQEMDKLRSSIGLEIADLSRNIAQCFDNNTVRSLSMQLDEYVGSNLQVEAVVLPSNIRDWSTSADQHWSDCNTSSSLEQQ